jgi:hypothetical protein
VLSFLVGLLPLRRSVKVQLDVRESMLWAAVLYHGGGGVTHTSYDAVIRVTNSGKHRLTVESAGWLASDGARLDAFGQVAALDPGDPTHEFTKGVDEIIAFGQMHRGIVKCHVQIAGEDAPRAFAVTNEWRTKVRDAAALPTEERW